MGRAPHHARRSAAIVRTASTSSGWWRVSPCHDNSSVCKTVTKVAPRSTPEAFSALVVGQAKIHVHYQIVILIIINKNNITECVSGVDHKFLSHTQIFYIVLVYVPPQTSFDGLISLNGFSGGYNLNSQVREERAIVAPYWTSRPGNKTCSNGTIEVHHVSETVDKAVFDVLKQLVLSSNTTQDFRPREAVVATWREIRESNQNNKVWSIS